MQFPWNKSQHRIKKKILRISSHTQGGGVNEETDAVCSLLLHVTELESWKVRSYGANVPCSGLERKCCITKSWSKHLKRCKDTLCSTIHAVKQRLTGKKKGGGVNKHILKKGINQKKTALLRFYHHLAASHNREHSPYVTHHVLTKQQKAFFFSLKKEFCIENRKHQPATCSSLTPRQPLRYLVGL